MRHASTWLAVAAAAGMTWLAPGVANAAATPQHGQPHSCTQDVGGTGLSAAVVARSHQTIAHRAIHTGCDIGIYVGAGVSHVTIDHDTVSGAAFQGIFAERTSHLTVEHSTVTGNGFRTVDPTAPVLPGSGIRSRVSQAFAISLFGVSDSTVRGNRVYDNGRGGIGIMDNGPNDPGAITQHPSAPLADSRRDAVVGNRMWRNYAGCAIVAATQNVGGHLGGLSITGNTITGTGTSATHGPDIGGLVVAADLPGSTVDGVAVTGNRVTDSFEGGVIVNAEAPDSSTRGVQVARNRLAGNNQGAQEAPKTAGVIVFANPAAAQPGAKAPRNTATTVVDNTISRQFYGVWSLGQDRPLVADNHIRVTPGGTPVFHG